MVASCSLSSLFTIGTSASTSSLSESDGVDGLSAAVVQEAVLSTAVVQEAALSAAVVQEAVLSAAVV